MSLTLNLGKATISDSKFKPNSAVVIGSSTYSISSAVSELPLGNIGKLELSDSGTDITFVAGSDFSGEFKLSDGISSSNASVVAVDFSEASGAVTFDTANASDVVSITGSEYNDKLTSNVNGAIINGGEGDDSITFSGDAASIKATIVGGEGDDKINVTGAASVSINDAEGDDSYNISGKGASISISDKEGDDSYIISGEGAHVTINDGNGADSLKITGKGVIADVSLSGNDNNAVTIDSTAAGIKANISVAGGDDIIVSKANNATLGINSADGDDVITISGQKSAVSIDAGAGDDVITVSGKESSVSINAGNGDDVIDITKADKSKITIATGDGDNTVKISAATVSGSVTGGNGHDDTLVISGANASLSVSGVENVNLTGKNGFVSVTGGTVNSSADGATINAATVNVTGGTAVLEAAATELNISKGSVTAKDSVTATVAGGTFTSDKDVDKADVITVSGYGANVNTGKGNDSITVSEDAYGTNTLTLGAGNDQVSVAAGKGKVVITDLDSKNDKLILTDASEDTVVSLSKNGVLNVVDAGQYNVTATVISGDYTGDYDTSVKNKAKNNHFYASVTDADGNVTELYTASGTTKKVSIDTSNTSNNNNLKVDLSAAKSSEVTLASTKDTWVTLGNGEDKVSIASGADDVTISNYNFANKDAITLTGASDVILHNDGVLTTGIEADDDYEDAALMVSTTANGGVYAARLNDVDYYTAKSGAVKIATDKAIKTNVIDVAKASSSTINIAAGTAIIKDLTAGADVINVVAGASVDASNAVYKYAQNDVINLGKAKNVSVGNVTLGETDDGEKILNTVISAKNGSTVSAVSVAAAVDKNGLYMAKVVSNNNKDTKTFVAADEDANVKIDLSAAAYGNVHFDALDAAAANVTIGAGDLAKLSNGEDVITVTGLTSTTKENVIIEHFNTEDDKLVLNKIKLADLTFDSVASAYCDIRIGYGSKKASVTVGTSESMTTEANININGTNVKAAIADNAVLTLNDDSKNAFFIGSKNTSLEISDDINNTTINLGDANKYKDVHAVVVGADATGITIVGTDSKKTGDSVDASKNENGVQVNLGAGNDSVTLSKGADVVWFNAKQGKDVISNFTYGVGDTADILNITDVKSLDKIKLGKAAGSIGGITVKDGSAVATIKTAAPTGEEKPSEVMKIQLGKKVYNVATDLSGDENILLNLDDEIKVDTYLGKKLKVALNSADGVAYTYNKAVSKDDIASINGSASNGAMKIYGVNTVTLGTSEEANANQVWAKGAGTINTANDYAGNDQVWFQGGVDKKVLVNGFASYSADNDANDNIKLVGTKSLANIVANYKFASKDGDMVITNKNSTSKLTVDDKDTVVLTDDANATYVVKVGTKDNGAEFTSDVKIYAGMSELSSSNIEDKTTIMLDGGSGNKFGYKSNYYIDSTVKKFDGTGSSGDLILVGSKNAKSELIGGDGNDVLYGGGAFNDTLKGGDGNNTFYFGANDGHDVIDGITENDTIRLYSGKLADPKLLGKYNESKDVFTFTFTDGSTLTVNGDVADGTKLVYGNSTYRYQSDNHKFIRVK